LKEKSALGREADSRSTERLGQDLDAEGKLVSFPGTNSNLSESITHARPAGGQILTLGAWLVAICLVILAGYLGFRRFSPQITSAVALSPAANVSSIESSSPIVLSTPLLREAPVNLPEFDPIDHLQAINRQTSLLTIIPTRPREGVIMYTVTSGDSIFSIANNYNIKPETLLWANYDLLKDNPDMISLDMELTVPPVDGVYYSWLLGDTVEAVANKFKAKPRDILNWPGNNLDLTNPQVEPGEMVLVPGGQREFVSWVVPTIPRGAAGVSKSVYGAGACTGSYEGAYGSGFFAWPSANRVLSGNDYWPGHLAIDIAAAVGDGIFAADSGVVVFAGWATGGYGYMVMIDHGNGYQTLYAHMSQVTARCGQSVYQGTYIGAAGSTGNSTGAHLHFEVRYLGGFVNPWSVLP
jgi:murein DD-endopeptidase MepM/ murein hydrolase activator NlpD